MLPIDLEALDPVQRMELADVLYDSAMQAIEDGPTLSAEQSAELDHRIDRLHAGEATLVSWESVRDRLTGRR